MSNGLIPFGWQLCHRRIKILWYYKLYEAQWAWLTWLSLPLFFNGNDRTRKSRRKMAALIGKKMKKRSLGLGLFIMPLLSDSSCIYAILCFSSLCFMPVSIRVLPTNKTSRHWKLKKIWTMLRPISLRPTGLGRTVASFWWSIWWWRWTRM